MHMTGKPVILKDLHNLYTQSKPESKCDFQELVDAMKGVKGKELHLPLLYTALFCCLFRCSYTTTFINDSKVLQAIFFQTQEMKVTFRS